METGAAGSMDLRPLVESSPLQGSRVIHPRSCDCHQEESKVAPTHSEHSSLVSRQLLCG